MYRVGDAVRLTFRVVDHVRALVEDATVAVSLAEPDGEVTELTPSELSTGVWVATFVASAQGRHVASWSASGPVERAQTEIVNVFPATEPVAIISLEQAREHLNMQAGEHCDDAELQRFIDAASRVVEQHTGEVIARRALVEEHWVSGTGMVLLNAAPVVSVTSVTTGAGEVCSAFLADSVAGIVEVSRALHGSVTVEFVAGRTVVPEHYQTACAIICGHLWSTQRTPLVTAGFGEAPAPNPGRGYLIPNQAAQLLGGRAPNRP